MSDLFYRGSSDQRTRSQSIYSLYLLYVTPPGDNFCENVQLYVCQCCVKQWVFGKLLSDPAGFNAYNFQNFHKRILFDLNFLVSLKCQKYNSLKTFPLYTPPLCLRQQLSLQTFFRRAPNLCYNNIISPPLQISEIQFVLKLQTHITMS